MDVLPYFSVIMPVYGAEKYLAVAVSSVLAQTFTAFELILVDDCSKDSCPQICDRFAKTDARIKVIHKEQNEGLSKARNTGLEAANGEYILFMDSDDRLSPNALQTCSDSLKYDTDILVFGVRREYENKNGQIRREENMCSAPFEAESKSDSASAFIMLTKAGIFPFAWNKIYRSSFLKRNLLRFEDINLIEDLVFNIAAFSKTEHIKIIDSVLYFYRKPVHDTLVDRYRPEFFELCKKKYTLEYEFLENAGSLSDGNLQLIYSNFVRHIFSVIIRNGSKKSGLSGSEKNRAVKIILEDQISQTVLANYRPSDVLMKISVLVLKSGNPVLCRAAAAVINFVRVKLSGLFNTLNRRK